MMGLHHISGKRRWPAINRARAMERLLPHFGNDAQAVCEALGVTKREFNLSVRTLALVRAYEESDYGDQLQPDQYNLFREVLRSEDLRAWIGWDHDARAASNRPNLNRLFSWMSNEVEFGEGGEDDQDGQDVDTRSMSDPAIATGGQVRELAKIIKDPAAVKRLDETRSLQEATLSSNLLVKSEIDGAFKSCDRGIERLHRRLGDLESRELDRVEQLVGKLMGIMLARKRQPPDAGRRLPWQPFNEIPQSQFSSIHVEKLSRHQRPDPRRPGSNQSHRRRQQRRQDVPAGGDLPAGAPERRACPAGRHSLARPDGGRSSAVLAGRAASGPRPCLRALRRNGGQRDDRRVQGGHRTGAGRRRPDFFSLEACHRLQLRRACTAHGCRVLRGPPPAHPVRGAELALPLGVHEPVLGQPSRDARPLQ